MNHNTSPISPSSPEQHAVPLLSPEEQAAYSVCEEYLDTLPGYQGAYSFGTPGGNDLDLRLCFENDRQIDQREISTSFIGTLRSLGVDKDVDLLFMSGSEFQSGIRDLEELGDVEDRLKDGFDLTRARLPWGILPCFRCIYSQLCARSTRIRIIQPPVRPKRPWIDWC